MKHTKRIQSKKFDGDIIITDPCYIIDEANDEDWEKCGYGGEMEALGLENFISADTIYGDWSCTTYTKGSHKVLGNFCADAGQVGVFSLDEVVKYNPKYKDYVVKPWTTTLIRNFKGRVWIEKNWRDDDINNFYTYVKVVGRGIDKITGERLDFFTSQTGF